MTKPDEDFGRAPIFWAIDSNSTRIFKYLLEKDKKQLQLSLTYKDMNPLEYALEKPNYHMAKLSLEHDPKLAAIQNKWGDTLLTKAIYDGKFEHVQCLVPVSDLKTADKHGNTPLEKALWEGRVKAVYEIFKDPRVDKNTETIKEGYTAFTKTLLMFHNRNPNADKMLDALVKMCVAPNVKDNKNNSPISLMLANELYNKEVGAKLKSYVESNDCGDYSTLPDLTYWFDEQGITA